MNSRHAIGARIVGVRQQRVRTNSGNPAMHVDWIDLDNGRSIGFYVAELSGDYAVIGSVVDTARVTPCNHAPMRLRLDIHDRRGTAAPLASGTATVRGTRTLLRAVADRVARATSRGVIALELLTQGEHEARYSVTIGTRDDGTPRPDGWFQLAVSEEPK